MNEPKEIPVLELQDGAKVADYLEPPTTNQGVSKRVLILFSVSYLGCGLMARPFTSVFYIYVLIYSCR